MEVMALKWLPFDLRFNLKHTWPDKLNAFRARLHRVFKIRQLPSFPPNQNPFHHDLTNMGTRIGNDLYVMHRNFDNEHAPYIILVHPPSGQRIRVDLPENPTV
jgi:hypothetical protein